MQLSTAWRSAAGCVLVSHISSLELGECERGVPLAMYLHVHVLQKSGCGTEVSETSHEHTRVSL